MIQLENSHFKASFSPLGAELQSLQSVGTGIEYMWSGDSKYWGKFSPVLFPIVGTLKDNSYFYNGKQYHLPRHGFAREKMFHADKKSNSEVVFTLESSGETLAVYPFHFQLQLIYRLSADGLSCTYKVKNTGKGPMLFSVGAHPAFAVPVAGEGAYNEYYLQLNTTEETNRWKLQDGLITEPEAMPITNGRIQLTPELFADDAIVLKDLRATTITLASNIHPHGLHFHFHDFPFFGIWAAKEAPFVCLEPWCGIADSVHHNQQLSEKEGMVMLTPSDVWERSWSVSCF